MHFSDLRTPPGRRWAGDLERAKKCRGFWMRTLCGSSSGQSVSRHRHALPSREILFLGSGTAQTVCAGGWVDGCVILEQQASTEVQGSPRSRSSRPETLPCSIWRCISGETWEGKDGYCYSTGKLLEITVEAGRAFQIPDQRLASALDPKLESWGALMSVSRPCPATPLHSRALPTTADEGRVLGRREPEHVRNGASSRIMYPFFWGA